MKVEHMVMQQISWKYNIDMATKLRIVAISPTYSNNLYVIAIFFVAKDYFCSSKSLGVLEQLIECI